MANRLLLLLNFILTADAYTTTDATNLLSTLFGTSYNNYVRPSGYTGINIEFVLFALTDIDMKYQTMSSSGWMTVTWQDDRLIWTPSSYSNISTIYTKQDKIWRPELLIANSVGGIEPIGDDELYFRVKNTGEVRWDPPGVYSTHCDIDVTFFPFDYQTCKIEIASFVYTVDKVSLNKSKDTVNTDDYNENGEWELHSTKVEEKTLSDDGEYFSRLEVQFVFKRRPGYYMTNIIFPVILISFLTNLAFILPADSGEKISYILTVLLALAVLLTLIADGMPTTSKNTSAIGVYLSIVLSMSTISVFITVFNLQLHLKEDQSQVPKWLQKFTNVVLLRVVCKNRQVNQESDMSKAEQTNVSENANGNCYENVTENAFTKVASLELMMASRQNTSIQEGEFTDSREAMMKRSQTNDEFPYKCKEVSEFLDYFFFYLSIIITALLTFIFFIVIAVCDSPSD